MKKLTGILSLFLIFIFANLQADGIPGADEKIKEFQAYADDCMAKAKVNKGKGGTYYNSEGNPVAIDFAAHYSACAENAKKVIEACTKGDVKAYKEALEAYNKGRTEISNATPDKGKVKRNMGATGKAL